MHFGDLLYIVCVYHHPQRLFVLASLDKRVLFSSRACALPFSTAAPAGLVCFEGGFGASCDALRSVWCKVKSMPSCTARMPRRRGLDTCAYSVLRKHCINMCATKGSEGEGVCGGAFACMLGCGRWCCSGGWRGERAVGAGPGTTLVRAQLLTFDEDRPPLQKRNPDGPASTDLQAAPTLSSTPHSACKHHTPAAKPPEQQRRQIRQEGGLHSQRAAHLPPHAQDRAGAQRSRSAHHG